ncbi:MAG TPA: hypothetical protein VM597_19940 [Gemmataceae bacterium]|nr:hypothetical protein [Gemmataceae bacterium]
MKRSILLAGLALCGCSTAPVADVLDWTFPGKSVPSLPPTAAGPPIPAAGPPPGPPPREPIAPPTDAPPIPPPPVDE